MIIHEKQPQRIGFLACNSAILPDDGNIFVW